MGKGCIKEPLKPQPTRLAARPATHPASNRGAFTSRENFLRQRPCPAAEESPKISTPFYYMVWKADPQMQICQDAFIQALKLPVSPKLRINPKSPKKRPCYVAFPILSVLRKPFEGFHPLHRQRGASPKPEARFNCKKINKKMKTPPGCEPRIGEEEEKAADEGKKGFFWVKWGRRETRSLQGGGWKASC